MMASVWSQKLRLFFVAASGGRGISFSQPICRATIVVSTSEFLQHHSQIYHYLKNVK
jgi:hypothetical protein